MSTLKTTNIQHPSAGSPAVELTAAGGLWLGGGKILQVVRATDSTLRSTTSTTFIDTGLSITITPQKSDSAIIVIATVCVEPGRTTTTQNHAYLRIADASGNAISGAEDANLGLINESGQFIRQRSMQTVIGYAQPATTNAVTYKLMFRATVFVSIRNEVTSGTTGQLYAIEVSS